MQVTLDISVTDQPIKTGDRVRVKRFGEVYNGRVTEDRFEAILRVKSDEGFSNWVSRKNCKKV